MNVWRDPTPTNRTATRTETVVVALVVLAAATIGAHRVQASLDQACTTGSTSACAHGGRR